MSGKLTLRYEPDGVINAAFYAARHFVDDIQGPVGSGKTTAALMKQLVLAQLQPQSKLDGVRRYRCVAIRDTYRELWRTTIKSWWKRVPPTTGQWTGGENQPALHSIKWRLADASIVDFELQFVAIGEDKAEEVMRGFEATRFYLNEADLLDEEVFNKAIERAGRYPDAAHNFPVHFGVDMDCNAPAVLSWLYKRMIKDRPASWGYYVQPPAAFKVNGQWVVNPDAENRRYLPPGYYEHMIENGSEHNIRRMLGNKPGVPRQGRPVYEDEWNADVHVSLRALLPDAGLPLIFGFDAGGSPAGVIAQRRPNGQWRILDEIIAGTDGFCGAARFSDEVNRALAGPKYAALSSRAQDILNPDDPGAWRGWADPSAMYGADKELGEQTWIQIVAAKTKIPIYPAPSNALSARLDAVRTPLSKAITAGVPALLISPTCTTLTTGFDGLYQYAKLVLPGGTGKIAEIPAKNAWSHVHDALQYLMIGGGEFESVMGRQAAGQSAVLRQARAIDEDAPYGAAGGFDPRQARAWD